MLKKRTMKTQNKQRSLVVEGTLYLEISARFAMEPAERMIAYDGRIVLDTEEGAYRVGWVKYYVVRVFDMLGSGSNPAWELDGESGDTADYYEFFNEGLDGWSDEVLGVWPEAEFGELVILDRLVVYPPFRGNEIGLLCLGTLTRLVGEARLFVMRPMPLQYIEAYAKDGDVAKAAGHKAADLRKLMVYYAEAGFREVPGTGRMALDPTMIGPMDKRGDSWAEVTLKRTAAMERYRLVGQEESPEAEG
jgi:GNAT superfamily N-acetyltransferase